MQNTSSTYFLLNILVLLSRFPRGQLQPVVFSMSCSLRSLAKIRSIHFVFFTETQKHRLKYSY
ncbi:hypothetical protein EKQ61_03115 [Staphylococcus gallinarum]|nr:hypothetical protein EKQ61_03115 [Staphylococcus gallinarum]